MTNETKNKFAEILAQANAKAAGKSQLTAKAPEITPELKQETARPELSMVTINDIINNTLEEIKPKVRIVDYSEKAFAVVGETKSIKDDLKLLGGKFNNFLSCGPGWIFSKKHIDNVKKALGL